MNIEEIVEKGTQHPYRPLTIRDAERFVAHATEEHGGHWTWVKDSEGIAIYACMEDASVKSPITTKKQLEAIEFAIRQLIKQHCQTGSHKAVHAADALTTAFGLNGLDYL